MKPETAAKVRRVMKRMAEGVRLETACRANGISPSYYKRLKRKLAKESAEGEQ